MKNANTIGIGVEPMLFSKLYNTRFLEYDSNTVVNKNYKDKAHTQLGLNPGIQYFNPLFHKLQIGVAYRHIGGSTFNIQFPDGYATIKVPSQLYLNAKIEFKAVLKSGLDIIPSLFYRTTQTSKWINGILSVQSSFVFKKWFDASPTMDIVGGKISNSGLIIGLYPLN